jgi:succinate-semialdehyde dehydrogenase/glutarate-semialdehyde dehydrogenase
MPWNFPFWQAFRCAVPAIMAGNVVLLKHAENVPQCARAIENTFSDAGLPGAVFTNLFIDHDQSESVIAFHGVKGVSLTGSDRAGSIIASQSGKNLKKTVLELGGSDPFIVLEDADIDEAVKSGITARMQNMGQSCICAKRFILHKAIADEFISKFKHGISGMLQGDPLDETTEMGPLARIDLLENLQRQVDESVQAGARIIAGGKRLNRPGNFYPPTILAEIPKDSPAYNEELFGPVASIFVVDSDDEAISLANDTEFGLGASVWTQSEEKTVRFAKEIQSGNVYFNTIVKSDPRIPFGGIKRSGYGRELSDFGIQEFVNIKTICKA